MFDDLGLLGYRPTGASSGSCTKSMTTRRCRNCARGVMLQSQTACAAFLFWQPTWCRGIACVQGEKMKIQSTCVACALACYFTVSRNQLQDLNVMCPKPANLKAARVTRPLTKYSPGRPCPQQCGRCYGTFRFHRPPAQGRGAM